jgi:hypothetical protein
MKTYEEIKEGILEDIPNPTLLKMNGLLIIMGILKIMMTRTFGFILIGLPMILFLYFFGFNIKNCWIALISHFITYVFYLEKQYNDELIDLLNEIHLIIKVTKDIKLEIKKNGKYKNVNELSQNSERD